MWMLAGLGPRRTQQSLSWVLRAHACNAACSCKVVLVLRRMVGRTTSAAVTAVRAAVRLYWSAGTAVPRSLSGSDRGLTLNLVAMPAGGQIVIVIVIVFAAAAAA